MNYYIIFLFLLIASYNIYNFYITKNYEILNTNEIKGFTVVNLVSSMFLFILLHTQLIKNYTTTNYMYCVPMMIAGLLIIFSILNTKYIFVNNKKMVKIFNSLNFVLLFILICIHMMSDYKNNSLDKILFETQNQDKILTKLMKNENDNDFMDFDTVKNIEDL